MGALNNCIEMMDAGVDRASRVIPQLPVMEARLCRLMLMLGSSVQEGLELELKQHKLNHSEFLTLMMLYSRPEGSSTPSELSDLTTQGATNMTRIGNALVKRGLIVRNGSKQDRRRVVIKITDAGRHFVQRTLPPMFPRIDMMFSNLSGTDKQQLDRLLRMVAGNLDQMCVDTYP